MNEGHNFRKLCKLIITLEYGFNDFAGALHESNMKDILNSVDFIDKSEGYRTKKSKTLLKKLKDIFKPGDDISHMGFENGTYLYQPFGTHGAPDFVIFINNTYLMVELKSNSNDGIIWNTSIPQKNWIYIFSSKKLKDTTYFLGQDIVPDSLKEKIDMVIKKIENIRKEIDEILSLEENIHGFTNYVRPMWVQKGKIINKILREQRYINSPYRKQYEKNVSTFIKNIFRNNGK